MKQLITLLTFSLITVSQANAQKAFKEPKYGEIAPWEWEINSFKGDTSVGAIVLADYGKYIFNANLEGGGDIYEYYQIKRIKILKQAAADELANVAIPYVKDYQSIRKVNAHTLTMDSKGVVIESKLDNDALIDEKIAKDRRSSQVRVIRFSMTNVVPGSIIEYSFRRNGSGISSPKWQFQAKYPTISSHFIHTYPTAFKYSTEYIGNLAVKSIKDKVIGVIKLGLNAFDIIQNEYYLDSVPAFKNYNYLYSEHNYISAISLNLADVRLENGNDRRLLNSWFSISRDLQKDKRFFNEDEKSEGLIATVVNSLKSDDTLTSIKNIYNYVKFQLKTIKSTDVDNISEVSSNVSTALKNKQATETLKLTIALRMFSLIGYDPAVVFIRTREEGYVQRSDPTLSQFDQAIIAVTTSKSEYLIDVSDTEYPFGVLPESYHNSQAWVVTSKEDFWVEVPMTTSYDRNLVVNGSLSKDGKFDGGFSSRLSGYAGVEARTGSKEKGSHHWAAKNIFDNTKQVILKGAKTDTTASAQSPVITEGSIEINDFADIIDDELFFTPVVSPPLKSNPFKEEVREYPVEFDRKVNFSYLLNLTIPKGYQVAEQPKNIRFVLPDKSLEFVRMIAVNGDQITVSSRFYNRKLVYSPEEYGDVRKMYDLVLQSAAEQIVLKPQN